MKIRSTSRPHALDDSRPLHPSATSRVVIKSGIPILACALLFAPLPAVAADGCVTIGFDDAANNPVFVENDVLVYEEQGMRFESNCTSSGTVIGTAEPCQFQLTGTQVLASIANIDITWPDAGGNQQSFTLESFAAEMGLGIYEVCSTDDNSDCVSTPQQLTIDSSSGDNVSYELINPVPDTVPRILGTQLLSWLDVTSVTIDASEQTETMVSDNWIICPGSTDTDGDGVLDLADLCPETPLFETPTDGLKKHSWMDTLGDTQFKTEAKKKDKKGDALIFTLADTGGCSCTQIAEITESEKHAAEIAADPSKLDKYMKKHLKHGCKTKLMQEWIDSL